MKERTNDTYRECSPAGINLGDTEKASVMMETLKALPEKISATPRQIALKTDELAGFNLILTAPQADEVVFYDTKREALEYCKLITEMIAISSTPEEFISRIFSRSVENFLAGGNTLFSFSRLNVKHILFEEKLKHLKSFLNEVTQWAYLDQEHDRQLFEDTMRKLSEEGRRRYEDFLFPYLSGKIRFDTYRCRRLLPCWPTNEQVPFSETTFLGRNFYGELEPNTNTFFFGNLWLTNERTFSLVKTKLGKAKVRYVEFDLHAEDISLLLDRERDAALYVSRLNRTNMFFWRDRIEKWKMAYQGRKGSVHLIASNGEIERVDGMMQPCISPSGEAGIPFRSLQETMDFLQQEVVEGHIQEKQAQFFRDLLRERTDLKKIMEIGFNAGHSAEVFLSSRGDVSVLSFDKMDHSYTKYGEAYLEFKFPGRHRMVAGDSKESVVKFYQEHPDAAFDLIFIDGGHDEETAWADINNCRKLARKDTVVIMDDIESFEEGALAFWSRGATDAWNRAIKERIVEELSRERDGPRGWAVGRYAFPLEK